MRLPAALALFATLAVLAAPAEVYKWTDSNGKVHYGDSPPDTVITEKLDLKVNSYEGPAQVTDWSKIIRDKSKASKASAPPSGIVMYSTSWCPHCKRARAYFAKRGVSYQDIDVEASASGQLAFSELGGGGVPLILVNGKAMRGFDQAAMDRLLAN
jgi:glutaredoxin